MIIGAIYLLLLNGFGVIGFSIQHHIEHIKNDQLHINVLIITVVVAYAFLAIILLVYPLSGYFADVWCGRYKAVKISLVMLCVAFLLLCCAAIIGITSSWRMDRFGLSRSIPFDVLLILTIIMIIVSLSCYQANIIQLGLDQLLEAPSEKLSQFIHWLMWAYTAGSFIPLITYAFLPCSYNSTHLKLKLFSITSFMLFPALLLLSLLLAFTCYNKSWFYSEPGQNDPYKTVYRVLRFAWKNKFPIRRSAFTYCDDFIPSRIDFAKERYGGPFTTSQVEDVKTFLRIVKVLVALGPIFVLEVPGSYYLFPLFALHVDSSLQFQTDRLCHSLVKWVLLQSGSLGYISSVIFFPLYIWVIFSLLRKRIPKILNRLKYAVCMPVAGVLCLLITDLIGHYRYHQHYLNNSTSGVCLFTSNFVNPKGEYIPNLLDMHWSVVIPPCILFNLGYLLVQSTAVEFILAQSPHSMKGLLVGVFFAIKGLFQFISAIAVVPFAIPSIWNGVNSVTNCGFGYYLFTMVVGFIGLVVLSITVRSYKYRQRDERPFDTRFAEQYYENRIQFDTSHSPVTETDGNSNRRSHTYGTTSNSDYGVIEDHDEMNICLKDSASQSYERLH
jgi:peptide/histidine transporter 3/4